MLEHEKSDEDEPIRPTPALPPSRLQRRQEAALAEEEEATGGEQQGMEELVVMEEEESGMVVLDEVLEMETEQGPSPAPVVPASEASAAPNDSAASLVRAVLHQSFNTLLTPSFRR